MTAQTKLEMLTMLICRATQSAGASRDEAKDHFHAITEYHRGMGDTFAASMLCEARKILDSN